MKTLTIGFIGGGRITRIFLQAFANHKVDYKSVLVYDTNSDVLAELEQQYPAIKLAENVVQVSQQSLVIIALHPPVIMENLELVKHVVGLDTAVVSLAPKISIEQLSSKLNTDQIVRMIPNATSYINEGYNPLTFASGFHPDAKSELLSILNVLGQTFEVAESKLEGYALISAMLPTYFWFQWNELEKLGIQMGLSAEESKFAVRDTLLAAIHLLYDSGLESDQVNNLIPVKPIGESEGQIREILQTRLMGLFQKIQPI